MNRELKRKGKAIGVKPPNNVRLKSKTDDNAGDMPIAKPEMTLTQRIVIAWIDKATILNLLPSDKRYKELQAEFMLDIASKIGDKFPKDIKEILDDNGDTATLLNRR